MSTDPSHLGAAELFRHHAKAVARVLSRVGIERAELEDLVQEVFLVAHRRGGFTPGSAVATTWLTRIALRLAANHRRRHARRKRLADRLPAPPELAGPETSELLARAQRALFDLDENRRLVFVLFELEGVSCEQIAESLDVPVGTVYSRLHGARAAFRAAVVEPAAATPAKLAGGMTR